MSPILLPRESCIRPKFVQCCLISVSPKILSTILLSFAVATILRASSTSVLGSRAPAVCKPEIDPRWLDKLSRAVGSVVADERLNHLGDYFALLLGLWRCRRTVDDEVSRRVLAVQVQRPHLLGGLGLVEENPSLDEVELDVVEGGQVPVCSSPLTLDVENLRLSAPPDPIKAVVGVGVGIAEFLHLLHLAPGEEDLVAVRGLEGYVALVSVRLRVEFDLTAGRIVHREPVDGESLEGEDAQQTSRGSLERPIITIALSTGDRRGDGLVFHHLQLEPRGVVGLDRPKPTEGLWVACQPSIWSKLV